MYLLYAPYNMEEGSGLYAKVMCRRNLNRKAMESRPGMGCGVHIAHSHYLQLNSSSFSPLGISETVSLYTSGLP